MIRRTTPTTSTTSTPSTTSVIPAAPKHYDIVEDGIEMTTWAHPATGEFRVYINGAAGRATKVYAVAGTDKTQPGRIVVRVYDDLKTGGERAGIATRAYAAIDARIGRGGSWRELMDYLQEAGRQRAARRSNR